MNKPVFDYELINCHTFDLRPGDRMNGEVVNYVAPVSGTSSQKFAIVWEHGKIVDIANKNEIWNVLRKKEYLKSEESNTIPTSEVWDEKVINKKTKYQIEERRSEEFGPPGDSWSLSKFNGKTWSSDDYHLTVERMQWYRNAFRDKEFRVVRRTYEKTILNV